VKQAVFAISLPSAGRARIMRFFVEAANKAGLTVFDDQAGLAFLPDGKVLPEDQADEWQDWGEELGSAPATWGKTQARKALKGSLAAMLAGRGFRFMTPKQRPKSLSTCNAPFIRDVEGGHQEIHIWLQGSGDALHGALHAIATHDAVEEIWNKAVGPAWSTGMFGTSASFFLTLQGLLNGYDEKFPLGDEQDVAALGTLVESKVIPILDRCRSLKDLDRLTDWDSGDPYFRSRGGILSRLIRRRLAGNPAFEAMAQKYLAMFAEAPPETQAKLREIVDHLRGTAPLP